MFGKKSHGFQLPCGRWVDPLAAYRTLLAGGANRLLDARESDDPAKYDDAETKLCGLVRKAFGLPAFDPETGTGATDEGCLTALTAFLDHAEKKGLGVRRSPTTPPPSASTGP